MNVSQYNNALDAINAVYPQSLIETELVSKIGDNYMPVPSHKSVYDSDGHLISVVTKSHSIDQPTKLAELIQPWLDSGSLKLKNAFKLKEGKKLIIECESDSTDQEIVVGDIVRSGYRFFTGWDGSTPYGYTGYAVRLVCSNGMARSENIATYSVRHTSKFEFRADTLRSQMMQLISASQTQAQEYKLLAAKKLTANQLKTYIRNVFELPESPENSTKAENKINRVITLLDTQRGLSLVPAIRGTAWQGYNAVTEYLTHESGRNEQSRLESNMFGENMRINKRALNLALTM